MSLMKEYLDRKLSIPELEGELQRLLKQYHELRGAYLFVYAASIQKAPFIPAVSLEQDDFYTIRDLLKHKKDVSKLDMYIETPWGQWRNS